MPRLYQMVENATMCILPELLLVIRVEWTMDAVGHSTLASQSLLSPVHALLEAGPLLLLILVISAGSCCWLLRLVSLLTVIVRFVIRVLTLRLTATVVSLRLVKVEMKSMK